MKIRTGFVSNSSSASFVINKDMLTGEMVQGVQDYIDGKIELYDYWNVSIHDHTIEGGTIMDNGELGEYFEKIGIPKEAMKWYDDHDFWDIDGDE